MMHRAWSSIVEVPYCFSRSYVKLQGHTALKIVEFDPNWAFPDCNSSLNSPMAMKCCTKLETAKERCPIVFQGHPSNFKVTRYKTSPILTQIGRFRTIGRSQLSNPSDLPCSRIFIITSSSLGITKPHHSVHSCFVYFLWKHPNSGSTCTCGVHDLGEANISYGSLLWVHNFKQNKPRSMMQCLGVHSWDYSKCVFAMHLLLYRSA